MQLLSAIERFLSRDNCCLISIYFIFNREQLRKMHNWVFQLMKYITKLISKIISRVKVA